MTPSFDLTIDAPQIRTTRAERAQVPWKNGQGTTEVVAETDMWRISVADEPVESHFSTIENYDRIFIPIGSETIELSGRTELGTDPAGGSTHKVEPMAIFRFPGEWAPTCMTTAPTRALNIMTRRGRAPARVSIGDKPIALDISTVRVYFSTRSEDVVLVPPNTHLCVEPCLAGPVVSIELSDRAPGHACPESNWSPK